MTSIRRCSSSRSSAEGMAQYCTDRYKPGRKMSEEIVIPPRLPSGGDVRGKRVVLTGSVLGERPGKGLAAYSASKAGLAGLAKGLALDLAPAGITVNVVAPGWFDSPLAEGWKNNPRRSAAILEHTPLGRWGAATDL